MNKPTRTRIADLKPTFLTELNDEQLVQATGGATVIFGTVCDTASWHCMDGDSATTDGHNLM